MSKLSFVRINDNFEPRFEVKKLVQIQDRIEKQISTGTLYYELWTDEKREITFVKYGLIGPDKWWSSNCNTISKVFGIQCIEATIKETEGECPHSLFTIGVLCEDIKLPDNLEFTTKPYGWLQIKPKTGIDFPRGKDYFMSTELDAEGNLIFPKQTVKQVKQ